MEDNQFERHEFTNAERSKGGQATKFNNLKHGKYARILNQAYVCTHCGNAVSAGTIMEQDALMGMLSTKQDLYEAIKRNIVLMSRLADSQEDPKNIFIMLQQINNQLIKLLERCPITEELNFVSENSYRVANEAYKELIATK